MDGHGGYTYSSSYTKNYCRPPHPVYRLAEPVSTPMPALYPRNLATHQLRSCSWPEVHTIIKVQKACFPWSLALMIASVPA